MFSGVNICCVYASEDQLQKALQTISPQINEQKNNRVTNRIR